MKEREASSFPDKEYELLPSLSWSRKVLVGGDPTPPFTQDSLGRFESTFCPDGSSCEQLNSQFWKCKPIHFPGVVMQCKV